MKRFNQFITEAKNTHMTHIEDLIFIHGNEGVRKALGFFNGLLDSLSGSSSKKVNLTTKFDGAPAIFAGIDPEDGKFFVGTKGVFNKNPKLFKTEAEVKAGFSGDLAEKMLMAFRHLKGLIKEGVFQGDIMFTASTLKTEVIDDQKYYTFHPNTIVYAVPVKSALGTAIKAAKIGIVWHTTYSGSSLQDMKASFGKSIVDKLGSSSSVWQQDAVFRDVTGSATFTEKETDLLRRSLANLDSLYGKINKNLIDEFKKNEDLQIRMNTFNNSFIRQGKTMQPKGHARAFMDYLHDYYEKEAGKRKTEKGQAAQRGKKIEMMKIFTKYNVSDFYHLFSLFKNMAEMKQIFIEKLNSVKGLRTFLKTNKGFTVTKQEGFVAIDHLSNDAVKLVDRLEFAHANFSDNVIKGWTK